MEQKLQLEKQGVQLTDADQSDCLPVESIALARLIEEVRTNDASMSRHYNRTYNRHNR